MFGSFSISEVLLLGVLGLLLIGIHRLFGRSSKTKAAHPAKQPGRGKATRLLIALKRVLHLHGLA